MIRVLTIALLLGGLTCSTGCLHHNTRDNCNSCPPASGHCNSCQTGHCGDCGGKGLLGKLGGKVLPCKACNGARQGCVAGPLGWQQGGLDYSSHLQPGLLGHRAAHQLQNQPFTPGPPTAQVGYPYYSHRGPRDFLLDNPPSIGR